MRLLAVSLMINNSDYFQTLCKALHYPVAEQLKRTAMNTTWDEEVQIQALSMALSHPIYSNIQFNSDLKICTILHRTLVYRNQSIDSLKEQQVII